MRTNVYAPLVPVFAAFSLLGAGCGQQASVSTGDASPTVEVSDTCGNPYYPFKKGLAVSYRVTPPASTVGDSDYAIRIADVIGTTAKIRAEMSGGAVVEMEADCADGSVALKGSSGLDATIDGTEFKTTVVSSEGTSMPSTVSAGTAWEQTETIKMEFTGGQAASMGPITMTTEESSRAIAEESVTVPAGTYKAMKVETTRTMTSKASFGAMPPSEVKSTEWWVKGIGMVKSVTVDEDGTSTVEATAVSGR